MAMITGVQIRAARVMLSWTVRVLARNAELPNFAVEWIEGDGKLNAKDRKAMRAIQTALEDAGIEFIDSVSVGLRTDPFNDGSQT
jgi:hypothetical protein